MGWAERIKQASAVRLVGLRIAVDVQHFYKPAPSERDRGAVYVLPGGRKVYEAEAALLYAQALVGWLRARGASVLTNDPRTGALCGTYGRRNREANRWGVSCYLACHLNAGGGNYALTEYVAGTLSGALAEFIGQQLVDDFDHIAVLKRIPLVPGSRGYVCIGELERPRSGILVEPFFGDNPNQQSLLAAPRLHDLGESIGEGVARWWERQHGR